MDRFSDLISNAPFEKIAVELLRMILDQTFDFMVTPDGVDCFGLRVDANNKALILFIHLDTLLAIKSSGRMPSVQLMNVQDLSAVRLISRSLLAVATEIVRGHDCLVNPTILFHSSLPDPRNALWNNYFYFANGSNAVVRFFKTNVNRSMYILRLSMRNDCISPAAITGDFTKIIRFLAVRMHAVAMPFLVVTQTTVAGVAGMVTCKFLGAAALIGNSLVVRINKRSWRGIGSCADHSLRPGPIDQLRLEECTWQYLEFDAFWVPLFHADVRILLLGNAAGGVWSKDYGNALPPI
ncbi:hypothetical protein LTR27_001620 [Elasticomyces elasticus]|nr:hypothetical protein LTR27_001620 [Elasticomyces elasticus]